MATTSFQIGRRGHALSCGHRAEVLTSISNRMARFAFADLKNVSSNEIGPRQRVIGSKPHRQERNPPQEGIIRRTLVIAPPSVWFSAHI